jgi:hypothetical protein
MKILWDSGKRLKMKILICGGRNFSNYEYLMGAVDRYIKTSEEDFPDNEIEIVSGGARGADTLAERYAKEKNLKLKVFPADWNAHGKKAGILRNEEMAHYLAVSADRCEVIAFWDGSSRGTANMISTAKEFGLAFSIYYYQERKNEKR